jgi:hypothetical protein
MTTPKARAIQHLNQLNQYAALSIATGDHCTRASGGQAPMG